MVAFQHYYWQKFDPYCPKKQKRKSILHKLFYSYKPQLEIFNYVKVDAMFHKIWVKAVFVAF
ncbi:hypothetical protein WA1_41855 [Scytonema hofmannii PCC 7110]|uniref:Uncharacterized protein n=1 Tax=Scytonema hofmannii PCC 7110 TaxID=128403 RepID=A0A139WV45_9CYAN|nr:hypothetical protein WA1_41855 [Scytonema hofmannii PCC 7110]